MAKTKILVFSDSHGADQPMAGAIKLHNDADIIAFLGDGESDFEEALAECGIAPFGPRQKRIWQVRGNCDWRSNEAVTILPEAEGFRFFVTHGHLQYVKNGLSLLASEARKKGCAAALFGHTHEAFLEEREGMLLMNPGSSRGGHYGIIIIENGKLQGSLESLS